MLNSLKAGLFVYLLSAAGVLIASVAPGNSLERGEMPPVVAQSIDPIAPIDNFSLNEVKQFYQTHFQNAGDLPEMEWTGRDDRGEAGDISDAFRSAILNRINAYRAFCGLPADIEMLEEWNQKAQEAAFLSSHMDWATHYISSEIPFFTKGAQEALARSNVLLGETGPRGIDLFIEDRGAQNYGVGHRRWILDPSNKYMGAGAVPFRSYDRREGLVLWVIGGQRPVESRRIEQAVVWPTPGFFPLTLYPERWSFSFPDADFSETTITATYDGDPVGIILEPLSEGIAENTLVWRFQNLARLKLRDGAHFVVNLSHIQIGDQSLDYTLETTLFDPDS